MENSLPSIPAKRYFTIGEVSDLCGVKPHVLRYWEQEFTQLRPMKRRGNRRYYQHHEVLMIRRIRDLLYEQGFTISGARNKLQELVQTERDKKRAGEVMLSGLEELEDNLAMGETKSKILGSVIFQKTVPTDFSFFARNYLKFVVFWIEVHSPRL